MSFLLQPWHILLVAVCAWSMSVSNRFIEFQNAQIDALLQKLGKKRLLLNDDQRRLLAVKAHAIGRKTLLELTTISPYTTLFVTMRSHFMFGSRELTMLYRSSSPYGALVVANAHRTFAFSVNRTRVIVHSGGLPGPCRPVASNSVSASILAVESGATMLTAGYKRSASSR